MSLNLHNLEAMARRRVGPSVDCERCGAYAEVEWCDVSTYADPGPVLIMGRSRCTTSGCVDEYGSAAVLPPDEPGQLTRADHVWLRRQRALADEFGRVARLLLTEVGP